MMCLGAALVDELDVGVPDDQLVIDRVVVHDHEANGLPGCDLEPVGEERGVVDDDLDGTSGGRGAGTRRHRKTEQRGRKGETSHAAARTRL